MTSRRRWLLFAALAAIPVAFGWHASRRISSVDAPLAGPPRFGPAPAAPAKLDAPHPAPPSPAAAEPVASPPLPAALRELPRWDVPLDQAVPRLRELADAGNVGAQFELSNRLRACTAFAQRQAEASDESDRKSIEEDKKNPQLSEKLRTIRTRNAQMRIDMNAAERRGCEKIPADLRANWLDPLDRAAQSGDVAAMRSYATLAIEQYDSVDAIVADVDEAIARRDKARAYLLEALRRGDAQSLPELAQAYSRTSSKPQLFAADPAQAYVYAYAGSLATGLAPYLYGNLEAIMSESAKSLNARQLADAQARGRRVFDQCCAKR